MNRNLFWDEPEILQNMNRAFAILVHYFLLIFGVAIGLTVMTSASLAADPKNVVKSIIIEEADKSAHVSASLALAVAHVESRFQSDALSPKGAIGVMQIMPRTGRTVFGLTSQQLYDPKINIRAGVKFLDQLIKQYDGRIDLALSHYNGGSAVSKNGKRQIIPYTKNYVLKVLDAAKTYADQDISFQRQEIRHLTDKPAYISPAIPRNIAIQNADLNKNIKGIDFWLRTAETARYSQDLSHFALSPSRRLINQMENNRKNFRNRLSPKGLTRYDDDAEKICMFRKDAQARVKWECI